MGSGVEAAKAPEPKVMGVVFFSPPPNDNDDVEDDDEDVVDVGQPKEAAVVLEEPVVRPPPKEKGVLLEGSLKPPLVAPVRSLPLMSPNLKRPLALGVAPKPLVFGRSLEVDDDEPPKALIFGEAAVSVFLMSFSPTACFTSFLAAMNIIGFLEVVSVSSVFSVAVCTLRFLHWSMYS